MVDSYTHKDLAALCAVSETTIKSYRRKFPGFIPVLTRGKPIRFKKEAGDVCLMIRDCFDKGMSVRETTKVLKENFKEERTAPEKPARTGGSSGVVTEEYLEKFFATAGQMMQGMASMATAQAKTAQRLQKLEAAVEALIEAETRNSEFYAQLLAQGSTVAAPAPEPQPEPAPQPTPPPAPEPKPEKVRARKIVNVKTPEGGVQSYALEKEDAEPAAATPPQSFLDTPIVIRNDQGEFLGVPGRLSLAGFVEVLVREKGGTAPTGWLQRADHWVFTMTNPGGDAHALYFTDTTTPRGNQVALLDRLDLNDRQTTSLFLQEFFRQVKDKV